ncbi:MAG: hypothetical protein K6E21_01395 [Bacilli bacterium]|nr:hypothetical protein [Bacilli bacterium]
MEKVFLILLTIGSLRTRSAQFYSTTITMPCGKVVSVSKYIYNSNDALIEADDDYGATKIGDASYYYNCFSYAIPLNGNENLVPDEDKYNIQSISQYFENGTCLNTRFSNFSLSSVLSNIQVNDILFYRFNDSQMYVPSNAHPYSHAPIITQVGTTLASTYVKSKWSEHGISQGLISQCPYYYNDYIYGNYGETSFDCCYISHSYNNSNCYVPVNNVKHKKYVNIAIIQYWKFIH